MSTRTIQHTDEEAIRALLLGRTVVKVDDDVLRLDDGTVLTIHGNEGCGGCGNGWFTLDELNDCPVNAIMAVEFEEDSAGDADPDGWSDDTEIFRVFVLAEATRIKLLEVSGYDNGYYGVGYWIEVTR